MDQNRKKISLDKIMKKTVIGASVSMLVTLILIAIWTTLINTGLISISKMDYYVICTLLVSAVIGSIVGAAKTNQKKMHISLLTGVLYLLLLLSITAIFFEGQYYGIGVSTLAIISGCVAALLVGVKGEGRSKMRRKKIKHR